MRILFVTRDLVPGNGDNNYTFRLAEILKSRGHEIAYFCSKDSRNLESEFAKYFVDHMVYSELISGRQPVKAIKAAAQSIRSAEVESKLRSLLRLFKPDIVHVQHLHTHIQPSVLPIIKTQQIPIIYTLNVYTPLCLNHMFINRKTGERCEACIPNRFHSMLLKRCIKGSLAASVLGTAFQYVNHSHRYYDYVDCFICPSQFVKRKFAACGFYPEKLHHLPYFLDVTEMTPRYDSDGYGLFFGRLVPEKGVDTILKALKGTQIPFRIVGNGESKQMLISMAQRLGLADIEFTGFKSGSELIDLISGAEFVVVPSKWHEVFGLVILEAFGCGKPVIGSRMGGIPEVIRDKETGYLFDAEDANTLRQRMLSLSSSPEATFMGKKARAFVEQHYNSSSHYDKLIQIYNSVLSRKTSAIM